jgi:energy-coupling factor transport system permease protein
VTANEPPFHTGAWCLWLAAALTPPLATRNPWLLLLVLAVAAAVQRTLVTDPAQARTWRTFLRLGLFLGLLTVVLNLLWGGGGRTVLGHLPRLVWHPTIAGHEVTLLSLGGPVTLEAVVHGLLSAGALLAVLLVLATFNLLVDHDQLVRRLPRALDRSATVLSIALTFVPELMRAQREIREALALRGYRMRRLRDLPPLFVALLAEGLERSMTLAESMDARGFGRRLGGPAGGRRDRLASWGFLLALGLLAAGAFLRLSPAHAAAGHGVLIAGALLAADAVWLASRGVRRTRYRREAWTARDTALAVASALSLALLAGLYLTRRRVLYFEAFPVAEWPPLPWLPAAAVLLLLAPLLAARAPREPGPESSP